MRYLLTALAAALIAGAALAAQAQTSGRIDGGFFAALSGDPAALKQALDQSAAAIAKNPNDADALVEHGIMLISSGGQALQKGDPAGMAAFNAGIAEMAKAVALAPENGRVRILRGIALHQAGRVLPEAQGRPMLQDADADFAKGYALQKEHLDQLGEHRLGELLQIRADLQSRLGRTDEAAQTYDMIAARLPKTEYAARAEEWRKTRTPLPINRTTCIGCHVTQ